MLCRGCYASLRPFLDDRVFDSSGSAAILIAAFGEYAASSRLLCLDVQGPSFLGHC